MNHKQLDSSNAIWDDGEWVSWDEINMHIHEQEEEALLKKLLQMAQEYHRFTGRPLPIYGEIGELYAQARYNFDLNKPGAKGSDGRFLNDVFEVKTITPFKKNDVVTVRKVQNFNLLVVVRIDEKHQIDSRIVERRNLPKAKGDVFKISWKEITKLNDR